MEELKRFYVYILELGNRRSGKRIYYTGYTTDISRRIREHLLNRSCGFMRYYHNNDIKKLVYVEVVNESKPMDLLYHPREREIKFMTRSQKHALLNSPRNHLISYIPNFGKPVIILKKPEQLERNEE